LIAYLDSLTGRADLRTLETLLGNLTVTRADIEPACRFARAGYQRNTIKRTDHYELLALCWKSGDSTPIHDHRGVSCAFKVIEGTGTEVRFGITDSGLICPTATSRMEPGYVCAADDNDIHMVANMQPAGHALVTLHIYSPPIEKMHTYAFSRPTVVESGELVEAGGGI
jgi:cysteine dioxygenase